MAFTGTMVTEAQIDQKTGYGVDSNYTDVMKTAATSQAEAKVCLIGGCDFVTNWASLNAVMKVFLTETVASMVAIEAIKYNTNGYLDITEAEDMINVLDKIVDQNLSILRDKDKVALINDT